jgi:DNA polymerase-3 subunit gamma/tau
MAIIRLTHVADLPSPEELLRTLQNTPQPNQQTATPTNAPTNSHTGRGASHTPAHASTNASSGHVSSGQSSGNITAAARAPDTVATLDQYPTFEHVIELIRNSRDVKTLIEVEDHVRLVAYQPGRIEFQPTETAPRDLAQRLGQRLQGWTGARWAVTVVNKGGGETIAEKNNAVKTALHNEAGSHPFVQSVITHFPQAKITQIRTLQDIQASAIAEALPEVEDEWDPFEEDG